MAPILQKLADSAVSPWGVGLACAATVLAAFTAPLPATHKTTLRVGVVEVQAAAKSQTLHIVEPTDASDVVILPPRKPIQRRPSKEQRAAARAREKFLQENLDAEISAEESTALNSFSPELAFAVSELEENAPISEKSDYSRPAVSEAQVDAVFSMGLGFEDENPYNEVVGTFQQNSFSEIREAFTGLQDDQFLKGRPAAPPASIVADLEKPEPTPRVAEAKKAAGAEVAIAEMATAPVVEAKEPVATPPARRRVVVQSKPRPISQEMLPPPKDEPLVPPEVLEALGVPPVSPLQTAQTPPVALPWTISASAAALPSLPAPTVVATTVTEALPKPRTVASETPADTHSALTNQTTSAIAANLTKPFETDLYVRLTPKQDLQQWLQENRAHIELYLQPLGTRDPQGTLFLLPDGEGNYRESADVLRGRYALVAGVYRPQDVERPYREIQHPVEINSETVWKHQRFAPDLASLHEVRGNRSGKRATVVLTLFKGASPEHERPSTVSEGEKIANGQVSIVSYPERGVFYADERGNVVIPDLAYGFTYVFEVRAQNYFRTFQTVPIYQSDAYQPVYLVSKSQTVAIAKRLAVSDKGTGVGLGAGTSVLMGRVFDPQTLQPQADTRVDLQNHLLSLGSYFQFFQDKFQPRTSNLGYFSFFNLPASATHRQITRPETQLRTYEATVMPQSGYYVELGRAGVHTLKGNLIDPDKRPIVGATIRLVGDAEFETTSKDAGYFEIPGIDFPVGTVSIDVEAPGYRLSRITLPWNPKRAMVPHKPYLVPEGFVELGLAGAQQADVGPNPQGFISARGSGNLIAGTSEALFKGLEEGSCLHAELWSIAEGKLVDKGHGPFPFSPDADDEELCLTEAAPGFTFTNLAAGDYLLKWKDDAGRKTGPRPVRIGDGMDSIAVDATP
ncbi:carboxypeptidase regulatory-like domain-containing protein [bacterium]|nr:carboxypeptidase regulatory-like domain-containing protein [bacterium]